MTITELTHPEPTLTESSIFRSRRPDSSPVVVIIGPSATGKSSVVRELHRRGVVAVHPTWTTRPRRADEASGSLEHRFVSDTDFDRLAAAGFFIDTVEMFGLPYRYGLAPVPPWNADRCVAVMLRAPLVERFRQIVPEAIVYQIEGAGERSAHWLAGRGGRPDDVAARLADNAMEAVLGLTIADRQFTNDSTVAELADRIESALRLDLSDGAR